MAYWHVRQFHKYRKSLKYLKYSACWHFIAPWITLYYQLPRDAFIQALFWLEIAHLLEIIKQMTNLARQAAKAKKLISMHDTKNIFLAWLCTYPCFAAAVETADRPSILSAIVLPILFFVLGKIADYYFRLYLIRHGLDRNN